MGKYILWRLSVIIPLLIVITILVFLMLQFTPGDPIILLAGDYASEEQIAQLRKNYGLDLPLPQQYLRFLTNALRGDLGRSVRTNRPVLDELRVRFPFTLELTLAGMSIAILLGVVVGVISAAHRNTRLDNVVMAAVVMGYSIPTFWLGLLLIIFLAVRLRWFPVMGPGGWRHLVLPAITLGLQPAAVIARLTRSSMIEVIGLDYIRTARAKGLGEGSVLLRHALKNALIPVVTVAGLQFGNLLGGAIITETIFAWPGLGNLAINAVLQRDYPMIQGTVIFVAVVFILVNFLVDILYVYLDPRIRYGT